MRQGRCRKGAACQAGPPLPSPGSGPGSPPKLPTMLGRLKAPALYPLISCGVRSTPRSHSNIQAPTKSTTSTDTLPLPLLRVGKDLTLGGLDWGPAGSAGFPSPLKVMEWLSFQGDKGAVVLVRCSGLQQLSDGPPALEELMRGQQRGQGQARAAGKVAAAATSTLPSLQQPPATPPLIMAREEHVIMSHTRNNQFGITALRS